MASYHSPSSCSSNSPYLSVHRSHNSTLIEEGDESKEALPASGIHLHPSPLHPSSWTPSTVTVKSVVSGQHSVKRRSSEKLVVSCNNCRPPSQNHTTSTSVVPVADVASKHNTSSSYSISLPSPNAILKSIRSSVSRRSPKPSPEVYSVNEEPWKIAVAELSHKLVHVSRKRDEAVLEASNLKYSIAELEKKLNKLETYCHDLKSGLEFYNRSGDSGGGTISQNHLRIEGQDQIIQDFLISVSKSRSAIRLLSQSLTIHIRQMGAMASDRIASLFQPFDIKISPSKSPRTLISYLEAVLNLCLFEDFESAGFRQNSANRVLNPLDRCEAQYAAFNALEGLTWEEVLSKGTRHFSEDFSKFCDRKMNEIVGLTGWSRAWPEQLLQAFFQAAKSVWLTHLLANSVYPGLTIFRVEKGSGFDSVYMEDMGGDRRAHMLVPTMVRIMVAPGFYVYDNVVKCKVLCRYHNVSIS